MSKIVVHVASVTRTTPCNKRDEYSTMQQRQRVQNHITSVATTSTTECKNVDEITIPCNNCDECNM